MDLSIIERAMIANQNKILALLDPSNTEKYLLKTEIAEKGYEGLYDVIFDDISRFPTTEEECNEAMDILDMYCQIEHVLASMPDNDKRLLNLEKIRFEGLHDDHDKHSNFMKFLIETNGFYDAFKGKNFKSKNKEALSKYKKMLIPFKENTNETDQYSLDLEGLKKIINAVW